MSAATPRPGSLFKFGTRCTESGKGYCYTPVGVPKLSENQRTEARERFRSFLTHRGLRQTPTRLLVLDAVYDATGHVDADEVHGQLQQRNHTVSRATVYNTLNLLLDCDLVVRHQFGNAQAKFEAASSYRQHDHLICLDCHEVMEFCDPRIQNIQEMVADIYTFEIKRHALNLYGHCRRTDCAHRPT